MSAINLSRFYSRRWEMVFMIFSGVAIVYTLRVNMSVAAQDMRDDLNWSEYEKGLVLSSFYWGYSVGQIPASWLIQRYGAKWIFGFSVLIPSILTLFVPLACRTSFGWALCIRCLIGFFESSSFPSVYHFFPIWIPYQEKTLMIPAIVSGMYMGEIIGFSLSGILSSWPLHINGQYWGGWQSVFYVFGLAGIVWFPYWAFFAYESPDKHPNITKEEVALIKEGKGYTTLKALEEDQDEKRFQTLLLTDDDQESFSRGVTSNSSNKRSQSNDYRPTVVESTNPLNNERYHYENDSRDVGVTPFNAPVRLIASQDYFSRASGEHRNISIISAEDDADREELARRIPYREFFTHPVSLTLFLNSWTFGFIGFTLLSEMPSFFTDNLGFDLESAGILCVFPYLALFISSLSFGIVFEYLQNHQNWSTDTVRQVAQYIAYAGSATGLIICGFMENKYIAYVFMILTQTLLGAAQAGLGCSFSDVAPNYSSALNSVGNTIGAVAGIVGPIVVAEFTTSFEGAWGWRLSFFLTGFLAAVSLIFWSIYQTSEPVPALNLPARKRI